MATLFTDQIEQEAIIRIQKFARIAKAMDLPISVGFSGGKDSQVTLDLCKRAGIPIYRKLGRERFIELIKNNPKLTLAQAKKMIL